MHATVPFLQWQLSWHCDVSGMFSPSLYTIPSLEHISSNTTVVVSVTMSYSVTVPC